jgi:hypothetical protein
MSPKKNLFLLLFLPALIALVGLACNMPLTSDSGVSQNDLIKTAAAQTLQAQVEDINQATTTLAVATPTTGLLPTATLTPGTALTPASPTSTNPPGQPSPTLASVCNQAGFVKDVSVPDNTEFPPGTTFEKTWRLKNTGTCTWNTSYTLVVDGQNPLSAPGSSLLTSKNILPGETVDVSVNLKAPDTVGTYRTNFKLRSDGGEVFGIGSGNKAFWAQIEVIVATGLTYDFNTRASEATWTSGTGKDKENDLTYGGDVADPNGTATVVDGVVLENKNTSGKVLLTIPKRTDNGYIQGVYPAYQVQPGDRLKGRVGFMIPSGSGVCGDGKLKFEVHSQSDGNTKKLGEWTTTCDGSLTPIDIDLSSLKGNSVKFVLVVRSVGPFLDNFGVWNSLGVFH